MGNSGRFTWVKCSSVKSSGTDSYQSAQYFRAFKQWFSCQCLGFLLTCAQMLMHAIAHYGCTDSVSESALKVVSGRKTPSLHLRLEPALVLRLAFQSDAVPAE